MASTKHSADTEPSKNLSYTVITWEVENFSLISYTQNVISSPPIILLGPIETSWRMHLHIPKKKNRLLLKVEMLPELQACKKSKSEIGKVRLHWAFCLLDEAEKECFSSGRIFSFEPKTVLALEYISLVRALEIANKRKYDNLILKFRMLIDFGVEIIYPELSVIGVEHLSNALCNLSTSFLHHDTTTTVNNVEFSLHKAMLFFRGSKLVRFMEQSTVNDGFSLSKSKAASAVFKYLYTGNLKFILDDPCLAIAEYTERVEIPETENVYSPERITVCTKIELQEYNILWNVPDFKSISGTVLGPQIIINETSILQLSLNVKESRDDPPKKSLSAEVTLIESELLLVLCLEFAFGTDLSEMLYTRKIHGLMGPSDRLSITLLEDDCPEMKECFLNENLFITVHVCRSIRNAYSYTVEDPISTEIPNEKSFKNLTKALGEMKNSAIYSDFYFEVEDQVFKAHKFLAAARSPLMKELFRRHDGLESVTIHGCTKQVFETFLNYMYIGIIAEKDGDKLIELYNFGEQYNVDGFVEVVLVVLSKCIDERNMFRVLIFADEIKDDKLKQTAFDYVVSKGNILEKHKDHDIFKSKKPDIYRQIKNVLQAK